jgi:Asp-tRNA(Asn)/Glu-tRNA(Gln) amidotransferase C subunit
MTDSQETVVTLAAVAGLALSEERCAALAPLFEALLAAAERLRSLDLTGYEPAGPGATYASTGG